jgi:Leucine-rich repeat (LRR) protein
MGCQQNKKIEDDNLRRAVNRIVNIEGKSIDEITNLDASFATIESLVGIERLENLEVLTVTNNMISDLSPLVSLEHLRLLDIQNNRVKDLSPLMSLSNLEILFIRNNPVDSIETIEPLFSKLSTTDFLVHVSFNDSVLESMIRTALNIPEAQLSYFDLEKLRILDLSKVEIGDLSGLEHAKKLEQLKLNQQVDNIEVIGELHQLKKLELSSAGLEEITFLKKLKSLEHLDISYNNLKSIEVIKEMTALSYLDMRRNKVSDVSPLKAESIKTLYIEGNYISDYNTLTILDQIKETDILIVYFNDSNLDLAIREQLNKTSGVLTLKDFESLTRLIATGYEIESLGGIELLSNLIELDLSENEITDLTPLEKLTSLKFLKLKENTIEDITSLIYLDQLNIVDLSFNEITSIEAFSYLPLIEYLYLEGNDIEDGPSKSELKLRLKATDEW